MVYVASSQKSHLIQLENWGAYTEDQWIIDLSMKN